MSPTRILASFALLLFCYSFLEKLSAHPAIEEQVALVNKLIDREPENASHFLKRGRLHQAHRNWEAALSDYQRAADLDPSLQITRLRFGETLLEAGRPRDARRALDEFLKANADHADALVLRGRVLHRLGETAAAVADYSNAIQQSARPQPDWYLERARAAAANERNLDFAIAGLDEGIARLGPLVTFQSMAIELELGRQSYRGALARVDDILARLPRLPQWLVKRAELQAQLGLFEESRASYGAALAAIDALPASRRGTKSVLDLEQQAKHSLSALTNPIDERHGAKE